MRKGIIWIATDNCGISIYDKQKQTFSAIHHRVKNNLQVISSLLSLQSSKIIDENLLDIFLECKGRVQSMALIHEKLYHSEDFSKVNFNAYMQSLIHEIKNHLNKLIIQ